MPFSIANGIYFNVKIPKKIFSFKRSNWRDIIVKSKNVDEIITCFNFSMISSLDTGVTSWTTLHFSFAQLMNENAHIAIFIGLPAAPIMQVAMVGRHCNVIIIMNSNDKSLMKIYVKTKNSFLFIVYCTGNTRQWYNEAGRSFTFCSLQKEVVGKPSKNNDDIYFW